MAVFTPNLAILPSPQRRFWPEIDDTPAHFTLYGGTALALRLGHRTSVDFDFFSNQSFDPDQLVRAIPYLKDAERVQVAPNTLTCRIERDGPVLVSFFGALALGQVAPRDQVEGKTLYVASLLDIAGTKVAVVQKRAEVKDYLDLDVLMQHGLDLPTALAAGHSVYGRGFNPMIKLKALSFFDDLPALPAEVRRRLEAAVEKVDPTHLPALAPVAWRTDEKEHQL
ncbi:MAG: nucleotidyl transferase AbiEii/AbiGii toxin family protein [Deltaproteobacteria bacterium]|nr:nucleotidyl transferase AbiEii/AbiGii toxin family protein [Deltaproteobacteria bacterium]